MALSWGHRPVRRGASAAWRARFALALVAAAAVSGFTPPEPPPPPNTITPQTRGEIQALLDVHLDRLRERDLVGYRLTVDPTRPALGACLDRAFEAGPARAASLAPLRVVAIERHLNSYLRATVRERDGLVEWTLRRAGVTWNQARPPFFIWRESWRWYVSEPGPAERPTTPLPPVDGTPVRPGGCAG